MDLATSLMESDKVNPKKKRAQKECRSDSPAQSVVGCLDVLKKLSCSVKCGGKTWSIQETELSTEPMTVSPKRRKKKKKESPTPPESLPPV